MKRAAALYLALCIVLGQVFLICANEYMMANSRAERARGAKGNFADVGANLWGACFVGVEVIAVLATGIGLALARRRDLALLLAVSGGITLICLVAGKVYWRESRGLW